MRPFFPTRLAEILFALVMGYFGVFHFMNVDTLTGAVPDFMPGDGKILIYLIGTAFIAAGLAILINKLKRVACYLLACMWLLFVFAIHLKPAMDGHPWDLLKDIGLALAAIIIGNHTKH